MRVMVLGASGLLGQALVRELKDEQLLAPSSKDVDLRDATRVLQAAQESRPQWIILAAAYTDVDGCESNRELAFAVNCQGAIHVAEAARAAGARLMFLSTDYVFDGTSSSPYETDDKRNPINVYGETKAAAEVALLEIVPEVCIVRTSWLFGPGGKCFPATILQLASSRPEISVVNDQHGCPTLTHDLASALAVLCRKSARGIIHATNTGICSWYDFGREIVTAKHLATIVKPVPSSEFPRPARRPAYSALSPRSLEVYGIHMPNWRDALHRHLAT